MFANSAWVNVRERLILRGGGPKTIRLRVRYGLVIHPRAGPVLIDTGYTPDALAGSHRGLMLRLYGKALRPCLNMAEQPEPLLAHFGLALRDVRAIIVTHFHADHVSGLRLFPNARFIASDSAWARLAQQTWWQRLRHGVFTELLPADFADRLTGLSGLKHVEGDANGCHGLPGGADLFGDGSMLAVDLPGHMDGHFGVLFPALSPPLLYAADAQWLLLAATQERMPGPPASWVASDRRAVAASNQLLRQFIAAGGEVVLCHDPDATRHDFAGPEAA
jgi:glyoxylase-like metal-dependent hydrolase (beta-lactamase superfamily II)